jgi:O-methyltransferase
MQNLPLIYVKYILTLVGTRLSKRFLVQFEAAVNYVRIGHWCREHGFRMTRRAWKRQQVWATVIDRVRNQRVLYLEFGVAGGASMRYWSEQLTHSESLLHGFDSFEGLPEAGGPWSKGQFDAGGLVPQIADSRVRFFKGWFDQVLPGYNPPPHDVLVINMDADLYSSTIYVLRTLRPYMKPGVYVYFDELNHIEHEADAFDEFIRESGLHFKVVSADKTLAFVFFECID